MRPLLLLAAACGHPGDPIPELRTETRCTGNWLHTVDGVPDSEGREVLDAEGRSIEEEWEGIGFVGGSHSWTVWETDAAGTDRMLEAREDIDGDDVIDFFATYAYALDDQLRLAWTATYVEGSPDREQTYTYDADDQLVAVDTTADGEPESGGRYSWEEGRVVRIDSLGPAGGVWASTTNEYLEPAPSLDRRQTQELGDTISVIRYDHDDADQVLAWWLVEDEVETLYLTQAWDDAGRLVDAVSRWPTGNLWGYELGQTHTTWTYDADGRLRTVRDEEDALADGTAEHVGVTEWSWLCE